MEAMRASQRQIVGVVGFELVRQVGGRPGVFQRGIVDVQKRLEPQLIEPPGVAQPFRKDVVDLKLEPLLKPPPDFELQ